MSKKTKEILLSILKAILIILIVGLLSMFFINKMEEKKAADKQSTSQTLPSDSTLDYSESENNSEEETIPEYEINKRLMELGDWKYYIEEGKAYIAGYIGEDKTTISIPNKIASYHVAGFTEGVCWYNEELKTVTIAEGIKEIPINAFIGCKNLTKVNFPTSLVTISSNAFKGCISLEEISIGKNVANISHSALTGLTSLKTITVNAENPNYVSENNILFNKNKTKIIKVAVGTEKLVIPSGVREISSYAISYNDIIKEIEFPSSLSTINQFGFYYCPNIEKIIIPKTLKDIKAGAFYGCNGIKSFEVLIGNQYYSTVDGILFNKEKTKLVIMPPSYQAEVYSFDSTTMYIESYAFINTKINTIIIPSTIQKIGSYAFIGGKNTNIQVEAVESVFNQKVNYDWKKLYEGKIEFKE